MIKYFHKCDIYRIPSQSEQVADSSGSPENRPYLVDRLVECQFYESDADAPQTLRHQGREARVRTGYFHFHHPEGLKVQRFDILEREEEDGLVYRWTVQKKIKVEDGDGGIDHYEVQVFQRL